MLETRNKEEKKGSAELFNSLVRGDLSRISEYLIISPIWVSKVIKGDKWGRSEIVDAAMEIGDINSKAKAQERKIQILEKYAKSINEKRG